MGALVVRGAKRVRGCRASRAQLYDCVAGEGARTGVQKHLGVRVALLGACAGEASINRAGDVRQSSANASVHARAGAGVDAGLDADLGAGADVHVGVGVGVGAYGCEEHVSGCVRGYEHVDVSSHLSFEVVVDAALVHPEEDGSGGDCASVGAGALANGGGGTNCHECAHMAVVHAGGVHQDQDATALVPM